MKAVSPRWSSKLQIRSGCLLNAMNFGGKRWVPWDAKASWRSAAEERLREMTCRSEKLERDRCKRRHVLRQEIQGEKSRLSGDAKGFAL